ncbi:MAG TPA: ChaN family lipoprotein [Petrimonas sp.]|jgi:uncharacterized iron-regulated protein|nr:ChaN family lipoprotein [Petrimonas sp.]
MRKITKHLFTLFFATAFALSAFSAENPQAYIIFNSQGEKVSFAEMIDAVSKKNVVFFGEMHYCPICHWLEAETTKQLYARHGEKLLLGAEMFETDNQLILNEYLKGDISKSSFEREIRLWNNYSTDYSKLVEFAKANSVPFYATNIPRRYAQIVSLKGLEALDTLSVEAKRYIAPLPIPYVSDSTKVAMFEKMTVKMMGHDNRNPEFMSQAQAIKDATMAWSISQAFVENPDSCFLHFNGSFHSDNNNGIIPFLMNYNSHVSIATISCCRQEDISYLKEANYRKTDFIICIPNDMVNSN